MFGDQNDEDIEDHVGGENDFYITCSTRDSHFKGSVAWDKIGIIPKPFLQNIKLASQFDGFYFHKYYIFF